MKQRVFICQQCGHELNLPRVGMNLREAKSWFKYATCPACKRQLCIVEKVPVPVISTYTQPSLWTGTEGGI